MAETIHFTVNGAAHTVEIEENETLLSVLRNKLFLTGTKECCKEGECGACTVLLDGVNLRSCQVPAAQANGRQVTTVEGLAQNGRLDPLQQAFLDENVVQCGICTPGMLMACKALLLKKTPLTEETILKGLENNICRCGSYQAVVKAVLKVNRMELGLAEPA